MSDLRSRLPNAPEDGVADYARSAVGPSSDRRGVALDHAVDMLCGAAAAHDLDGRLPGLSALRSLTLGDPRITIVILDGNPDLSLSCFSGSRISKIFPYWHDRAEQITVDQHALFREILNSNLAREQKGERFLAAFSRETLFRIQVDRHATHVTSGIAGRRGSPVPGIAPDCRVIVVPLNEAGDPDEFLSPLNLGRAFDLAHGLGADIIHCAACVPTQTDAPHELLARAIRRCVDDNILIVSPAGNNDGECRCIPAVLPGTLAIGALNDIGAPFKFSNWGGNYSNNGIMALGNKILGAQPGTEQPVREMGTSVAAPIVTAISALLMSRQLQIGRSADARAIREVLLDTARNCDPALLDDPAHCLRGVLDLPAAFDALFASEGRAKLGDRESGVVARTLITHRASIIASTELAAEAKAPAVVAPASLLEGAPTQAAVASGSVEPSTAYSGLVYALGSLSYDFGSEIGLQEFEQYMDQRTKVSGLHPVTPYRTGDLIEYLVANPTERDCLIWTLVVGGAPVYGLVPDGPFDEAIYDVFLQLLAAHSLAPDDESFVERISVPGRRTGEMVRLQSKATIPVLAVTDLRGIYGWKINVLVADTVKRIYGSRKSRASRALHEALIDFLNRVYFDLHNLGQKSRDRAMNFAATNLFQAASVFAEAIADGRAFNTIVVKQSPLCRAHSDCWDVSLTFVDPNDDKRAAKVFDFTIDVFDILPVTVGNVKAWFKRRSLK